MALLHLEALHETYLVRQEVAVKAAAIQTKPAFVGFKSPVHLGELYFVSCDFVARLRSPSACLEVRLKAVKLHDLISFH
jgi:hypothetical protein